jgi:hypothetical protein
MSELTLNQKIGNDILQKTVVMPPHPFQSAPPLFKGKIVETLVKANKEKSPMNIKQTSDATGISWITCKSILLELLFAALVTSFKSKKSLYFQLSNCKARDCENTAIGVFTLKDEKSETGTRDLTLCETHLQKAKSLNLLVTKEG